MSLEIDLKDFFLLLIYKTSISPFLPLLTITPRRKSCLKNEDIFFLIVKTSMVIVENLLNIEM